MSKVFYDWINTRLDEYAVNRARVMKAHASRWANVIAKQNNGDLPTESERDGVVRFHAPYDGYVPVWMKGDHEYEHTNMGGQFLPYDSPNEPMFGGASMDGQSILEVPVERADKFMAEPKLEKAIKQLNIVKGYEYKQRGTDKPVCNIHLNNCPADIRSAIDNHLMGDIYRLQRLAAEQAEQERNAVDLAHRSGADVEEGRQVITGVVLGLKWKESQFGSTLKMLVQDDRGFRVWGTCPSSLEVNRTERVQFTATVERSNDDPKFGFFKRPTKAVNLSDEEIAA